MILRWLLLSLSVVVLSPNLLCAQSPRQATLPSADPVPDVNVNTIADYRKMYEDIEILRRILDHKLHPLFLQNSYSSVTHGPGIMGMGGMGMGGGIKTSTYYYEWPQKVDHPLEGVYLKGQGIVYTSTLSSLQLPAHAETAKPVSEWESVRRQLHNEKEGPKRPEASKPPELSEVMLKILAENGHHFTQLGDNESLTVVITVRGTSPSSLVQKPAEAATTQGLQPSAGGGGGDSDRSSKKRDLELLGDLHLKQGRYDEAIVAFTKAVDLCQESRAKAGLDSVDDLGPKQAAALCRKLAQCYLMKGQDEDASAVLNMAIAFLKKTADAKNKPVPAAKSATTALPVKLIISAPRQLLDQVSEKAGVRKITFDEFRRRATVETLTFNTHRP